MLQAKVQTIANDDEEAYVEPLDTKSEHEDLSALQENAEDDENNDWQCVPTLLNRVIRTT